MKKALIVVDMQNDFIDGSLGTKEAQAMLPRLLAKLAALPEDTDLIFTMDTHGEDYLTTQEGRHLPVRHCIKPSSGWELSAQLQPYASRAKKIIEKRTFGAKDLPEALAGYDQVELVGLCTDICVISNAMLIKAFYPELPLTVDADCCAGVTPASHANALSAMQMCQIEIESGGSSE